MRFGIIGIVFGVVILTAFGIFWYRQTEISAGTAAYNRNDYVTAYKDLSTFDGWRDANSQYRVARMLANGDGTAENDTSAFNIILKLSQGGSIPAAAFLAGLYDYGHGTKVDPVQAVNWYEVAANGGDLRSQVRLGQLYETGTGVQQDYGQAASLYKKAADQGYVPAETRLGALHIQGNGVPQDYQAALSLFQRAAAGGDHEAEAKLGAMYANGQANSLSFDQVFSDLKSSAEAGNADAEFLLGGYLTGGNGQDGYPHELDLTLAYTLFDLAAAQGDHDAVAAIGQLKGNLMDDIIKDAQNSASKWHEGSPLPTTSLDDYAAQTISLSGNLDKQIIGKMKIWFSVNWNDAGKQDHAVFFKQIGSDSGADNDPGTCHACAANISVVTFQGIESQEDLQSSIWMEPPPIQTKFTTFGAYGDVQPPENDEATYDAPNRAGQKQYPIGAGKYLVLVPYSYGGQGETDNGFEALIWIDNPSNYGIGSWADAGNVATHQDNSGECGPGGGGGQPCYSWDGTISVRNGEGGLPEIIVTTKGQMPNDSYDGLLLAPSATYKFNGKQFMSPTKMN